ncbi:MULTISPECIES: FAD-dependent oxidoreductase [unclassified Variovorax]|uniref:FAD-dependent oxidoreductase n=1 Tax=unclassified Variovorax TaxID=663243 RepID=UPI00076DABA9|nr:MULTISPECIES: FAD-dependent oxidoreductase [unclassified Variovorax]KWT91999.1 2-polyprenyl-6-methoxyphenol hydroxylase [Variovorax sp. WDL1]PNG51504.1 Anhydrotetracycline monooxygenase [Variovorax sp. B2]PNG54470.1 Anhydrotetracycline monooxygenase [Variovorax sp. B4]VTV11977.1 3-(3-hydroxy-phenyl)propionate/3-hydroxycinnamic acid hydroxylase [Variovorax sp. WDL1]
MDATAPVDYQSLRFDYRRHPDQDAAIPARHPVVVVGAGPVGLALAIDLAQQQVPVVLLDNDCTLSTGSRAICFAKRTLEVFDRLGCGERMVAKGVSWNVGKVFFRDEQVYRFDLLPEAGHERPAFINLQQYYVEGYLAERAAELPLVDLRWNNKVVGIDNGADGVVLQVETPEGSYRLVADYVAACDGSRSNLRQLLGQEAKGRVFRDRFLIADISMDADLPTERRFWFDPPFHPHQSVLLHKQADGMWRVDFQLGWEADPVEERKHERIIPRVRALLDSIGFERVQFSIGWASVYTFACQRMERFRHGRVLFAGDSAHGVSPFGARGANSGVQDADNLAWKLAAVVKREAPDALLDSYGSEREYAADENIRNSTRATDFITPKSEVSRLFRDAVLELSKTQPFARALVNSGRLSVPTTLHGSPLNTPDADAFEGRMVPGAPAADAPIVRADGSTGWLLRTLPGRFTALVFGEGEAAERSLAAIAEADRPLHVVRVAACGEGELAAQRYDARPGTVYLLRPDQHVCARWRAPGAQALREACDRALARSTRSPA